MSERHAAWTAAALALATAATVGRPFWSSALGVAAVLATSAAVAPRGLRARLAPAALAFAGVAVVAVTFAVVRG